MLDEISGGDGSVVSSIVDIVGICLLLSIGEVERGFVNSIVEFSFEFVM